MADIVTIRDSQIYRPIYGQFPLQHALFHSNSSALCSFSLFCSDLNTTSKHRHKLVSKMPWYDFRRHGYPSGRTNSLPTSSRFNSWSTLDHPSNRASYGSFDSFDSYNYPSDRASYGSVDTSGYGRPYARASYFETPGTIYPRSRGAFGGVGWRF